MQPHEHAASRIGCLTSSMARMIMRPTQRAWATYRQNLWSATPDTFMEMTGGARQYGHEHEAEGAAKFWMEHPELTLSLGGYHQITRNGVVLGSSPDRCCIDDNGDLYGLEIKSPTSFDTFKDYTPDMHVDQCQHGLLVTGWKAWDLFVHIGKEHKETRFLPDPQWQELYMKNAKKFWDFCYNDAPTPMRRIRLNDLEKGQ